MASWTTGDLSTVGGTDELALQSRRDDGSLRDPVTIWVVRHGDDLYVRPVRGRAGWFAGTQSRHEGHISSGGVDRDVSFADADPSLNDSIDGEYRAKDSSYPARIVDNIMTEHARSATIKLVPR
ncbi:MAG TPA: DUF2255 family protein [Streptosporangiaceae bacterium]|jgi:hypothetical protein